MPAIISDDEANTLDDRERFANGRNAKISLLSINAETVLIKPEQKYTAMDIPTDSAVFLVRDDSMYAKKI